MSEQHELEDAALRPPGDSKCLLDLLGLDGAAVEESALLRRMNQIAGAGSAGLTVVS